MLSEEEARDTILEEVKPGGGEDLSLAEAGGRYLARDLISALPSPSFDQSAMDGYAVRHEDAKAGAELTVTGEQAAGRDLEFMCGPLGAVRIFTGAPLPEGATAVVMQEDVEKVGENRIRLREGAGEGEFIRRVGEDHCVGQLLAGAGSRVGEGMVGVLASQGMGTVAVGRVPRVRVLTTGDEVVGVSGEAELRPGELYNSNGPMLSALCRGLGVGGAVIDHVRDELTAVRRGVEEGLSEGDILIVVGGVSVGERDFVKRALSEAGVETLFWRVKVRPGKPLYFGKRGKTLVFGLPGNPVSAFVTFHLFVAPALRKWMGASEGLWGPVTRVGRVLEAIRTGGDRPHYLTGRMDWMGGYFRPVGIQQSHAIGIA
ncbi:MAG: gephyrin-like molybdotransferase Glp, partial [Verrucomicrobiota bacterium]